MKRIEMFEEDMPVGFLYIGTAREICSLYKNLDRREIAATSFCEPPKFNMERYYGLSVRESDVDGRWFSVPKMNVVAGDTALAMIFDL